MDVVRNQCIRHVNDAGRAPLAIHQAQIVCTGVHNQPVADAVWMGGLLQLHVDEDRAELLPAGWGHPLPSADNRLMVSHILPIRPPDKPAAQGRSNR